MFYGTRGTTAVGTVKSVQLHAVLKWQLNKPYIGFWQPRKAGLNKLTIAVNTLRIFSLSCRVYSKVNGRSSVCTKHMQGLWVSAYLSIGRYRRSTRRKLTTSFKTSGRRAAATSNVIMCNNALMRWGYLHFHVACISEVNDARCISYEWPTCSKQPWLVDCRT